MKLDKKGLDLIKSFEGCRLKAYKCVPTEKYYTIGYGHYGKDVKKDMVITSKQAEDLLKKDVAKFEQYVNSYVKVDITQSMFNALTSFCYNCGGGALGSSNLLKYLNKKEYNKVAAEFPKWNKSGGKVLNGLVKRREKERKEFLRLGIPTAAKTTNTFKIPSLKGYKGFSLVDGLRQFGYKYDMAYRAEVWKKLGKTDKYKGSAAQNTKMLNLLKTR